MADDTGATVDIVMGTYNGARFLAEQVESIRAQSVADWRLLIRDDGSRDDTPALLRQLAAAEPRITIVEDDLGNLSVGENFARLLSFSTAPYAMYCDQDDRWLPEKIAVSLARAREMEAALPGKPILVHTDAAIADGELREVRARFIGAAGRRRGLPAIVFHNIVQGATILMNAALRQRILTAPLVLPYDFHAALIAELTGARSYVDEPLMLYRQHGANVVGVNVPAADTAAGATDALPGNIRRAIDMRPGVDRLLDQFAAEASPAVLRERRLYETILGDGPRLGRVLALFRRDYGFPGRLDRLRMAKAILTGRM